MAGIFGPDLGTRFGMKTLAAQGNWLSSRFGGGPSKASKNRKLMLMWLALQNQKAAQASAATPVPVATDTATVTANPNADIVSAITSGFANLQAQMPQAQQYSQAPQYQPPPPQAPAVQAPQYAATVTGPTVDEYGTVIYPQAPVDPWAAQQATVSTASQALQAQAPDLYSAMLQSHADMTPAPTAFDAFQEDNQVTSQMGDVTGLSLPGYSASGYTAPAPVQSFTDAISAGLAKLATAGMDNATLLLNQKTAHAVALDAARQHQTESAMAAALRKSGIGGMDGQTFILLAVGGILAATFLLRK